MVPGLCICSGGYVHFFVKQIRHFKTNKLFVETEQMFGRTLCVLDELKEKIFVRKRKLFALKINLRFRSGILFYKLKNKKQLLMANHGRDSFKNV